MDTTNQNYSQSGLLVTPVQSIRQGWAEACQSVEAINNRERAEKLLISDAIVNQFDMEEWEW